MKNLLIIVSVLTALIIGFALLPKKTDKAIVPSDKVTVEASFYPVYFFAKEIGGDYASVTNITPAGAEPHDYEPTPKQMADIESAKLLVLAGGVEAWGERVMKERQGGVVVVAKDLMTRTQEEGGNISTDPHVWLSPTIATRMIVNIENAYIKIDPAHADYYRRRASTLAAKVVSLDTEYRKGLASCAKKDIVTSHAAFGYLAQDYGLNQVSISGLSPEQEPSAKKLTEVAAYVRSHSVNYIFFESLLSPKLAQTIAQETGAKTLVLDPIEGISDTDLAKGADYFSVMRKNLNNLEIALVCQ